MNDLMKHLTLAGTCLGSLLLLSSCGDSEQEQPTAPPASSEPATPPEPEPVPKPEPSDTRAQARDVLFDYMLFTSGKVMSSLASLPQINEAVKEMLEKIETYYAELNKAETATPERVRVGLRLAQICRELNAYAKAKNYYEAAEKDLATLPEESRTSLDGMRLTSSIKNGLATCWLYTSPGYDEPKRLYAEALQIDKTIFDRAVPKKENLGVEDITPAVSDATCELLGSYRCLADCLQRASDAEEARDVLKEGIEKAGKLGRLDVPMVLSFSRLLIQLGDLENSVANRREALGSWTTAQRLLQGAWNSTSKQHLRLEIKQMADRLNSCVQSVQEAVKAEDAAQSATAEPETPAETPTEPVVAPQEDSQPAATEAASETPAQPKPEASPAKTSKPSASKSKRKKRR